MKGQRGFSLLEVLCATSILIVGLAALAQLVTMSARINRSAKTTTLATVAAAQKMEQLRGLAWGIDNLGAPLSDTILLSPSPADSLKRNISGYSDFLDRSGRSIGGGSIPPPGAAYVRRWFVQPLPTDPANTLVLQVLVTARVNPVDDRDSVRRLPDEALLVSVKTRKAK
jgi:prepilin-type N-terminal cleavage/methylation domain-containing protein